MSGGIFRATIRALGKREESLALFLTKRLKNGGIELPWVDIVLGEERIFALLSDGRIEGVMVHEAVLNDLDFQHQGAPHFHFAPCAHMRKILAQREDSFRFLASIPSGNSFDFKTTSGGRTGLRFFREIPLEPCPLCQEILKVKGNTRREVLDFNQLIRRNSEGIAQKELDKLRENFIVQGFLEFESYELLREHGGARIVRRAKQ